VLIKKLLAEFIGTCFLVMVVVGSGIMAENLTSNEFNILLANTIVTGAGLTALIWIFINISGAHFNPAVSLVMFLNKELKLNHLVYFICFQIIGAITAFILMNYMQKD
jgi:glycerol uptake facilitator-like aquaporin